MKSRNIILIVFVVGAFGIGLTTIPDGIIDENQSVSVNEFLSDAKTTPVVNQPVTVNEFSSESRTITVGIVDGVGSGDTG